MQSHQEDSPFDWIREGREPLKPRGAHWIGNFVSNLIPPSFDGYVKILHTITARYDLIDNPLTPAEMSILKIPACEELRSLVRDRRGNPRIRWREIAVLLNVPFAPEICHEWYRKKLAVGCWPRFLYGPADGVLDESQLRALVSVLAQNNPSDCFFRFPEIPFIGTDKPLLFQGRLTELEDFVKSGNYQVGPEYCWPLDRSWCVCSDYDLTSTIVGGSKKLISVLLGNDSLECLEVRPQTRIDYMAPMPE